MKSIEKICLRISIPMLVLSVLTFLTCSCKEKEEFREAAAYANPMIGTDGHGHTFPGATLPFGMVQLSPATRLGGWDGASGYHYTDSVIYGFTHTALNGTGVGDYGDILLMPVAGEPQFINDNYLSTFKKENEKAEAGFYSVFLEKPGVFAELTATARVGFHRYSFSKDSDANIIIDLQHRDRVTDSWIEFVSDTEIRGMRRSTNWANDLIWFFHMEYSKPFIRKGIAVNDGLQPGLEFAKGLNIKAFVGFDVTDQEPVKVKVAISAVDSEGALKNLKAEIPGWNFEEIRAQAFGAWNKELSKIRIKGESDEQKEVFYTALYHAYLQPNIFMDVDRRYRGIDKHIHTATDFTNYTVFSLWDTYRAWHPLMSILEPGKSLDFVKVMLNMYEQGGMLPVWELAANETNTMIGYHSVPVIVDLYMKGLRGFDAEKALEAMLHSAMQDHLGLAAYRKHGYIPGDKEHESISKTLEYAYDDWCIARMAKEMGRADLYKNFIQRAQFYKNIFDPSTGFMRPKLNGNWLDPFDPTTVDWHFTEANSWQYSFYVPQDITGFYTLHGGKENLVRKLDELFTTEAPITGRDMKDISGLIGQYAHGNEPSHHMAYLYNFLGQPWKTQQRVRQIMDTQYSNRPDGLSGNEDCGQMSAWLIMSAMGFYPVTPGLPEYIIGTPWFEEMEITLENGNVFKIIADKVSEKKFYIQSVSLNGKDYPFSYISHADIMKGGRLHFVMGKKPNKNRGVKEEYVPVTYIQDQQVVPVPVIASEGARIKEPLEVEIFSIQPGQEIYYTLDGSIPSRSSLKYEGPFILDSTVTLKAVTFEEGLGYSYPAEASFVKLNIERSIKILSQWHPNYHGGGKEALIDGLRGSDNWRLGGWQGYTGTDFEAIVDLGRVQPISYVAAGFVQEIRSWIWMPVDVTFYLSTDGEDFQQVAFIQNSVPIDDYSYVVKDFGAKVHAQARYVKVKATNFGTIPDWHLGAGGNAYIFVDEIIVE